MMTRETVRSRLVEGTIAVIARDGLDKATAKQIETETGLNVVYIYRHFKDKEDLFANTFAVLDQELAQEIEKRLPVMWMPNLSMEERCRLLYVPVWRFMLDQQERCSAFCQYYYSPYFKHYSIDEHHRIYSGIVEQMSAAFRPQANVWMLLSHLLNVMTDFAVKVCQGAVPDNDDTAEHVFRLLYFSVSPYFKDQEEKQKQ